MSSEKVFDKFKNSILTQELMLSDIVFLERDKIKKYFSKIQSVGDIVDYYIIIGFSKSDAYDIVLDNLIIYHKQN